MSAADHNPDDGVIDRDLSPLMIVRARAADPVEEYAASAAKYTVYLHLSRTVTEYERDAFLPVESIRLYGETLEIRQTTLEEVGDRKSEFKVMVREVERKGRARELAVRRAEQTAKAQADAEEVAKSLRHNAMKDLREAERERRRVVAARITFE